MNTQFKKLLAACNRHLETPNAKLFAAAILEAEAAFTGADTPTPAISRNQPESASPATAPAITLRPYNGENAWPQKWPNPDALLAACVGGAKEGQLMKSLGTGQFATRHAIARLEKEGWLKGAREHEGASRIWSPLTVMEGGVATLGEGSRPPLTVPMLREFHETEYPDLAETMDAWLSEKVAYGIPAYTLEELTAFAEANKAAILAGCTITKRDNGDAIFWLNLDSEPEPSEEKEPDLEETIVDV